MQRCECEVRGRAQSSTAQTLRMVRLAACLHMHMHTWNEGHSAAGRHRYAPIEEDVTGFTFGIRCSPRLGVISGVAGVVTRRETREASRYAVSRVVERHAAPLSAWSGHSR